MVLPRNFNGGGGADGGDGGDMPDRSRSPMRGQNDGGWNNQSWGDNSGNGNNDSGGDGGWKSWKDKDDGGGWKKNNWNDGGWKKKDNWNKSGDDGDKRELCRFYAKAGWCKSGDNCPYKHVEGGAKGDWECPACGDKQFARNLKCRKCGAPRPGGTTGDDAMDHEANLKEAYISAVKVYQRESDETQEIWWWFCDIQGYKERYDPRRKDLEFLKDFVLSQHIPFVEPMKPIENGGGLGCLDNGKGGGKGKGGFLGASALLDMATPKSSVPFAAPALTASGLDMSSPPGLGETPQPDMNQGLAAFMAAFPNFQPPAGMPMGMTMPGLAGMM
jgi:predicted RNA-binding Zn-ribbon protein involved in translation (DUF1610 family)